MRLCYHYNIQSGKGRYDYEISIWIIDITHICGTYSEHTNRHDYLGALDHDGLMYLLADWPNTKAATTINQALSPGAGCSVKWTSRAFLRFGAFFEGSPCQA